MLESGQAVLSPTVRYFSYTGNHPCIWPAIAWTEAAVRQLHPPIRNRAGKTQATSHITSRRPTMRVSNERESSQRCSARARAVGAAGAGRVPRRRHFQSILDPFQPATGWSS
jgi:hypothetical protein